MDIIDNEQEVSQIVDSIDNIEIAQASPLMTTTTATATTTTSPTGNKLLTAGEVAYLASVACGDDTTGINDLSVGNAGNDPLFNQNTSTLKFSEEPSTFSTSAVSGFSKKTVQKGKSTSGLYCAEIFNFKKINSNLSNNQKSDWYSFNNKEFSITITNTSTEASDYILAYNNFINANLIGIESWSDNKTITISNLLSENFILYAAYTKNLKAGPIEPANLGWGSCTITFSNYKKHDELVTKNDINTMGMLPFINVSSNVADNQFMTSNDVTYKYGKMVCKDGYPKISGTSAGTKNIFQTNAKIIKVAMQNQYWITSLPSSITSNWDATYETYFNVKSSYTESYSKFSPTISKIDAYLKLDDNYKLLLGNITNSNTLSINYSPNTSSNWNKVLNTAGTDQAYKCSTPVYDSNLKIPSNPSIYLVPTLSNNKLQWVPSSGDEHTNFIRNEQDAVIGDGIIENPSTIDKKTIYIHKDFYLFHSWVSTVHNTYYTPNSSTETYINNKTGITYQPSVVNVSDYSISYEKIGTEYRCAWAYLATINNGDVFYSINPSTATYKYVKDPIFYFSLIKKATSVQSLVIKYGTTYSNIISLNNPGKMAKTDSEEYKVMYSCNASVNLSVPTIYFQPGYDYTFLSQSSLSAISCTDNYSKITCRKYGTIFTASINITGIEFTESTTITVNNQTYTQKSLNEFYFNSKDITIVFTNIKLKFDAAQFSYSTINKDYIAPFCAITLINTTDTTIIDYSISSASTIEEIKQRATEVTFSCTYKYTNVNPGCSYKIIFLKKS